MNVQIGDLLLGSGTNYHIKPPLEGLDSPDVRTSSFEYSGKDGGATPNQYFGMRPVTIQGTIVSSTCEEHDDDRAALRAALPIRTDIDVLIYTYTGKTYRVTGKRVDLKMPIVHDTMTEFKIEILCADPLIYDITSGSTQQATINRQVSGGYVFPYVLPVTWQASSGSTLVPNLGETVIYPVFEITGVGSNPIITNLDTGEVFGVNVTLTSGDSLLIDMRNRTVTLNGGSVIGLRTSASTWWGLAQGDNHLLLDSASGSDTLTAYVRWDTALTGA